MGSEAENGVTIRTFATRDSAELAVAQLEANGITCCIKADDCAGLLPSLSLAGGVRVIVSPADAEAARDLLGQPISPPASPATPSTSARRSKIAVGQIVLGIILGVFLALGYQQATVPDSETHNHYTADGKLKEAWVYRRGHLVQRFEDRNLDGTWDYWVFYDSAGRAERIELDNNFDGKPDETWIYTNGDIIGMQKDNDFNGVSDEFCIYKYHVIQQMDMRPNGSAFTTVREIYSNGVLSELWTGGESNGHFKEIVKYDPFFNPVSTNPGPYSLLSVP